MSREGFSAIFRDPNSVSGLKSARFYIYIGTQTINGPTDSEAVLWPSVDFDDIGIPDDYLTTGDFYLPDGEYIITCYTQIAADPPFLWPAGGYSFLDIMSADLPGNEEDGYPHTTNSLPKYSVTTMHRVTGGGTNPIWAEQFLVDVGENAIISEGSMTFTQTKAL